MQTGLIERPDHPHRQFRGDILENKEPMPKIGQVAKMLKVAPSKVRYVEAYFGLEGKRNGRDERLFTPDEIAHLRRLMAVCKHSKLSFVKKVVRAGMLSEYVALINQVAERNLTVRATANG